MTTTGSLAAPPARLSSSASSLTVRNTTGRRLITYWPCAFTNTAISFERSACLSASAEGRLICSSAYLLYVVVIMRKIRITIITSISGTRFISSGSFSCPRWKFIATRCRYGSCPKGRVVHALAVQDVNQLGGGELHLHHEGVDLVLEVAVEDERGNGDGDAE